jgi:hypothetical protein
MARIETHKQRGSILPTLAAVAAAFAAGALAHAFLTRTHPGDDGNAGAKHILVVLSNAVEGADDVFNDWYTNTHLPDVIRVKGFSGGQRFRRSSAQMDDDGGEPYRYLAIYEVDADDVRVPRDGLRDNADNPETMYVDPALDRDRTVAWFYTPITGLVKH